MKHLFKRPKKRVKPPSAYNGESGQPIYRPERCVICDASLGDAELGTLICYKCQHEDPTLFVPKARKRKKSDKEVKL